MRALCSSLGEEIWRLRGGGREEEGNGLDVSGERLGRWVWVRVVGGAFYGASIGLWRVPAQAGWVAVKMPLLILLTLAVNGVFNGMMAAVLGTGLGFRQTLVAIGQSFAVFAVVVGALGPVAAFFTLTLPAGDEPGGGRAYHGRLLTHTAVIAAGGWLGLLLIAGLALFGFLLGTFSGGTQLWAAPLKVVLGVAASGLICLPSFYIFLCLGGGSIRLKDACGLLATGLTLASLLLMALAPVVWLFAQATSSTGFMGVMALGFWLVAVGFGLRLILRDARLGGASGTSLLAVWTVIFLAVTLQMSTSLRPILGTADRLLPGERRFFLEHWARSLGDRGT